MKLRKKGWTIMRRGDDGSPFAWENHKGVTMCIMRPIDDIKSYDINYNGIQLDRCSASPNWKAAYRLAVSRLCFEHYLTTKESLLFRKDLGITKRMLKQV